MQINEKQPPALLTIGEFSDALRVTRSCTRRWLLERKLEFVKCGRLVRIPAREVARMIAEGLHPAKAPRQQ